MVICNFFGGFVFLGNLKPGRVSGPDLRDIAQDVKEVRKRFGRALGVKDSNLEEIVQGNPRDIAEQSYKILTKWSQARSSEDASYNAIAQALYDRTVNRPKLVLKFCVKKDSE